MPNVSEIAIYDGREHQKIVLELLEGATSEISISTYILENDEFGNQVFELLRRKSATGVNVRLIVDGYGSLQWIQNNHHHLYSKNFEARVFHPLPLSIRKLRSDLPKLDRFFQYFVRMNRRNHQKLFLIDQSVAIMGSRNINDEAIEWRETSLLVRGNPIAEFVSIFEEIWQRSHESFFKNVYRKRKYKFFRSFKNVFSNHLFLLRRRIRLMIQKKIIEAKSEIYITTPYFMPPPRLLRELCRKAVSGVKVCLLLPKTTDVPISKTVAEMSYERLLKSGVKIFEYSSSILHAKSMIVDDWVFVGSSNMNRRSFLRDLELDYVIEQPETIQSLKKQFLIDLENSDEVQSPPKTFFMKKMLMKVVTRVFASWF